MAIKKLQQNFTTIAQSNRLLELGLPVDSADCFMRTNSISFSPSFLPTANSSIICKKDVLYTDFCASLEMCDISCIPIWSAGRLIEIMLICGIGNKVPNEFYINKYSLVNSLVENIISRLERIADLSVNDIDFSKLED